VRIRTCVTAPYCKTATPCHGVQSGAINAQCNLG